MWNKMNVLLLVFQSALWTDNCCGTIWACDSVSTAKQGED